MAHFENSNNSTIHASHLTYVQGDVNNNYNGPTGTSSGTMDLIRKDKDAWPDSADNFTRFKLGDFEFKELLSCLELEIRLEDNSQDSERRDTNPFRLRMKRRSTIPKVVKVTRTVYTAEIAGRGKMVTVVRYEAEGGVASHALAACKPEFECWSRTRHPKLPQLFGVTHASIPALVYHNVYHRYQVSPSIYTYLRILYRIDFNDVCFSVPGIFNGQSVSTSSWDFDFSTRSFYYNLDFPVNTRVKAPLKINSGYRYIADLERLVYWKRPQISPPALDNGVESRSAIIDYVSRITGDYLDVIAVINKRWGEKRGPTLASFRYTEIIPKWRCETGDVNTSFVNSCYRISFPNRQQGGDFTFEVYIAPPMDTRQYFRRAFSSQSFVFMNKAGVDPDSCYLLDFVMIRIKGQFEPLHSAASADPIYLFVGPFEWEDVDGMHCLKCPPNGSFAHWSLDPDGPSASVDTDYYGLPQLEQEFSVGSRWDLGDYEAVEKYLCFKGYDLYSTAYAEDKGYPLLTYRNIGPEGDHRSVMEVINDEASSNSRDGFDVASHRSNQRRMKKIGSKIRRFVDSFAGRKKYSGQM